MISPRQVGKTTIAAMLCCTEAILWDGEPGAIVPLVAQDSRAAQRAAFQYVKAFFERDALRGVVARQLQDTVHLDNGCAIAVYPCRPAALRSIRAPLIVLDEAAFFQSSEGYPRDHESFAAALPTTYSTKGKVLVLSSPERQEGLLWSMYRKHYGKPSPVLAWKAKRGAMRALDKETERRHRILELEDLIRAASENEGEFRAGADSLFDPDRLDAVLRQDGERPPRAGVHYVCFLDVNLGKRDKNALAIGHLEGDRIILDLVRSWSSGVSRDEVTSESAGAMKAYGILEAWCDRVAGDWAATDYQRHSIKLRQEAAPKSDLYHVIVGCRE